ncbi:MAG: polysaccharide deacetylase family protein, partial [Nitrospiraceae bacterium]
LTGHPPALVRPPYWWFNADTLGQYERHGLSMMLSDIKAYDGVNWDMHVFKRWSFRSQLRRTRDRLLEDCLPVVNGTIPIVVTFHDTNTYTARHVDDYLRLLREETRRAGLPLHEKPFYDDGADIMEVALRRAVRQTTDAPTRKACLAAR